MTSLLDARAKLAAAIDTAADGDFEFDIHPNVVDAIVPPAVVIGWRAPMLSPGDQRTPCIASGNLFADLIVLRITLDSAVEAIESMYQLVQARLRASTATWRITNDSGIVEFDVGNVKYLACRIEVSAPITL